MVAQLGMVSLYFFLQLLFSKVCFANVPTGDPGVFELSPDEYDDALPAVAQFFGADNEMQFTDLSVTAEDVAILGTGPSELRPLIMKWLKSYDDYRKPFANVANDDTVYNHGLQHSTQDGVSVDYHISTQKDALHSAARDGIYLALPFMMGAVHVGYNIPGTGGVLSLTMDQLLGIFTGKITTWDDASPSATLTPASERRKLTCSSTLTVVPLKNSTETRLLTKFLYNRYLRKWSDSVSIAMMLTMKKWPIPAYGVAGNRNKLIDYNTYMKQHHHLAYGIWTFESGWTKIFPQNARYTTLMVEERPSALGILGQTLATNYSFCIINSVESVLSGGSVPYARLQNAVGNYIAPAPAKLYEAISEYYESGRNDSANGNGDYLTLNSTDAYPLTYMYYFIIRSGDGHLGNPINCSRAVNLFRFLRYIYGEQEMRDLTNDYGTAFVPAAAYAEVRNQLRKVKCGVNNDSVWILMKTAIRAEMTASFWDDGTVYFFLLIALPGPTVALFGYLVWRFVRFVRMLQKIRDGVYKVSSSAIFLASRQYALTDRFKGVVASRRVVDYYTPKSYVHTMYFGHWRAHQVMLRPCSLNIHRMSQAMKKALVQLMELSSYDRLATFYGLSEVRNGRYFVSNFCPYGDLRSIIIAKEYTFSLNMKFSLAGDIADGMEHLHKNKILHGNLRSCAVYVEADFSAKIGDWEYNTLHRLQGSYFPQETRLAQTLTLFEQTAFYPWLYWTAPEVLQCGMLGTAVKPSKKHDIYSFGIILGEIFGEETAFQKYQDSPYNFTPTEIITKILSGNLRPRLVPGAEAPASVVHLMNHCWTFVPEERPDFLAVKKILRLVTSPRKPISDLVVVDSQILADKLKKKAKRTEHRYKIVANNFHRYSRALVPFPIWRRVYIAHVRPPLRRFEDAVVLRGTLCNYGTMMASTTPATALNTINLLHRVFEEMIEANGRIYRLFQDGAAVVAVGGAPFGLELDPVHGISQTALNYLAWANSSKAPHQPPLRLKFGIHCGAVAAGCVDYSAAHYVLLGELMKVALNVEQASEPYRILISDDFHAKLRQLAKVYVKYRVVEASVTVRGYEKKTYWLTGSNIYDQQYILDDILYGKDELDKARDEDVVYGAEPGIIQDCHLKSIVPVDGKNIRGSGEPKLMDSAAIIRGLKKRKAAIMKVPPPHVLKAQVIDQTGKKKFRVKEHYMVAGFQTERHHTDEERAGEGAASPADVLVGLHHASVERQPGKMKPWTSADLQTSDIWIRLINEDEAPQRKPRIVDSRPSVLSSVRTIGDNSIASGESRSPITVAVDVLSKAPYTGILGLETITRATAKLEDVPQRPYTVKHGDVARRRVTPTLLSYPVSQTMERYRRFEAAEALLDEALEGSEDTRNEPGLAERVAEETKEETISPRVEEETLVNYPAQSDMSEVQTLNSLPDDDRLKTEKSSRCVSIFADPPSFSSETATLDLMPSVRVGQEYSLYINTHMLEQSDHDSNETPSDDGLPFTAFHERRAVDQDGLSAREPVTALEEQISNASHEHFISHLTSGSPSMYLHLPTAHQSRLSPSQSQHDHRG